MMCRPTFRPPFRPTFRMTFRSGCAMALVAAVLASAGCASSPPTRYYTLEAVAPGTPAQVVQVARRAAGTAVPPLRVRAVQIPPALDRPELVREVAPGQIDIREFDHWAAPLGRMSRQALHENLAARLPPGTLALPGAPLSDAAGELTVDILSFKLDNGSATMVLDWALRWPVPAALPASRSVTPAPAPTPVPAVVQPGGQLRLETPAGSDAGATARAWSALLAQLADTVAASIAGR